MALGLGGSSSTKVLIDLIGRDSASPAFLKAAGSAESASARMVRAGSKMQKIGGVLTKSVTLPLIGIAAASLKTAVDFQKGQTLLQTAAGESGRKMAVIGKGIQKVAVDTGTSLSQLNEGMYVVAKAGAQKWSATGQLEVLKAAAQGAKAENVDLGTAVSALTSVMKGYGLSAKDAVSAENQIIRASGLSKTTMSDFAGSLSNVIPLASSLKISFAQIGGAIATMTQHGETAQRATENLSNLITNLAGQNNVASQAMQQLGINVVSLQKGLSQRGLTGTLGLVEKAIAKNSKGGMVVVSAFKQAQQATHDLHVELANMTGPLQANSKAFAAGKMGYKDYYTFVKSLGGQQYEMGKQFITTTAAAKGFNTQLSSGNSDVRTTATELQKLLGGVTGMRTALMLGGTSASQFKANVREIGIAAQASGKNVLGWAKTQDTLAVKVDKAKAQLQVLGLQIGQKLLPPVTSLIGKISSAAHWFETLSPGVKSFIERVALVAGAIGPVVGIIGRLTKTIGILTATGGRVRAWATGTSESMATVGRTATRTTEEVEGSAGATGAVGGRRFGGVALAGGLAAGVGGNILGSYVSGGSKAGTGRNIAGSALSGAGTGAMLGSFLGPEGLIGGALIGGAGGALASYITGMMHAKKVTTQFDVVEKNGADTINRFAKALLLGGKNLGANQTAAAKAALGHTSLAKEAAKAGLTETDLTDAITGSTKAYNKVVAAWQAGAHPSQAQIAALLELRNQFKDGTTKAQQFADAHGAVLQGEVKVASQTAFLSGKLGNLNSANLKAGQVSKLYNSELGQLTQSVKENGKSLDGNSLFGQRNISVIRELTSRALQHAQAVYQQTGSVKKADVALANDRAALINTATQSGLTGGAVRKLANRLSSLPKNVHSKIIVDTASAQRQLSNFGSWFDTYIAKLRAGSTIGVSVKNSNSGLVAPGTPGFSTKSTPNLGGLIGGHAAGGSVRDGWFTVGEQGGAQGFELGHKTGSNVQIFSNRDSRSLLGGRVPGYASGTTPGISTTTVGGDKKWVYDGIKYASLSAAQNAQHRAATNTSAIGSAIGSIGAAAGSKFYVKDVGITRIMTQIGKAFSVLEAQIGRGLKAKAAKPFEDELNRYLKLAQKQLTNLRAKINGHDLATLKKSLTGTAAGAAAAFSSLIKDARNAGFSTATLDRLIAQQKKLTAVMRERAQVTSKLTAAQQTSSGVQSSFTGFFDVTSAGGTTDSNGNAVGPTFGSLFAAIKQAANQSKRFVSVVKKLAKEGLSRVLVAQLAQAGPSALPQALALASATPKQLAQFNSQYKTITSSGTTLGDFTAGLTAKTKTGGYANGVAAAQGYINGLKSQKKHLTNETEKIFNEAGKVVGKATKQEVVLSAKTIAELKAAFKDALSDVDLGVELDGKKVERASKKAQHRLARLT